ncbi:hypothetical protein CCR87_01390, partial [Rhodobaculum claviforme]|nr:hypothetical protein [Rhodobaculum claviforme]
RTFQLGGLRGVHLTGRGAAGRVAEWCHDGRLVILGAEAEGDAGGACMLIDRRSLARTGALALDVTPAGQWRIVAARDRAGQRPWSWR